MPRGQARYSVEGSPRSLYGLLKAPVHTIKAKDIVRFFSQVSKDRVRKLADTLSSYLSTNLAAAIDKRSELQQYRTNPYVLLTSAHVMNLDDAKRFADFLFNTKLYMGLETSFGKSIEAAFVSQYPLAARTQVPWGDAPEKIEEAGRLAGMVREEKAAKRVDSVWREIDKSCVVGKRRYLISIKSGPNCINDTQVQGMTDAVIRHYRTWLTETNKRYRGLDGLDVVVGLTYGTDRTTNNKENQILAKLLANGFKQEDPVLMPGVLLDEATGKVRIYRRIGKDFWATIGNPADPESTQFVFLEILLALVMALNKVDAQADLESRINGRIQDLIGALRKLTFPRDSLPDWVRKDFTDKELFWFATALTAFYDDGM